MNCNVDFCNIAKAHPDMLDRVCVCVCVEVDLSQSAQKEMRLRHCACYVWSVQLHALDLAFAN